RLDEPESEVVDLLVRRVFRLVRLRRQEHPVDGIEAMRAAILGKDIPSVSTRVRRYGDELDLLLHRRLIDHGLDFGDALRVQRAYVRTIRIDEVQDNDLAAEIGQADEAAIGALQYESGRVLVDRVEIVLPVAQGGLEFLERVGRCRHNRR